MKFPSRTFAPIFASLSLIVSFISFVGAGFLEGFISEEFTGPIGFWVFDNARLFTPIKRYLHLAIIPAFIGLLIITLEKMPVFGKLFQERTLSANMLALITFILLAIQTIPAIYVEDHIYYSNPTWLSDWLMDEHDGYILFTIIFVLAIFSGLLNNTFSWLQQKRSSIATRNNAIISLLILITSYISFKGMFHWNGFLGEYKVESLNEFLLIYSQDSPFQGVALFFHGPVARYTHLISIPGIVGLMSLMWKKFRKWVRSDKAEAFDTKIFSKLGMFSLIIILVQILPVIMFGTLFPDLSPTWLSDIIMNWVGYPLFTLSYFLGLIRAMTGNIIKGDFKLKK